MSITLPFTGALLLAAAPLAPAQDLTQHHVFSFGGEVLTGAAGTAAIAVGDLDGDGRSELAVGEPHPMGDTAGRVAVYDGATGVQLLEILGPEFAVGSSPRFGASLALLPDLDGDGGPELAVGLPRDDGGGLDAGAVQIHGLDDGLLLQRFEGLIGEQLGLTLAAADLDGDGLADLIAGGPAQGVVVAWSSGWVQTALTGQPPAGQAELWSATGVGRFGDALTTLGDLDGDGRPEVAVGAPTEPGAAGSHVGAVHVLSGADGSLVARVEGEAESETFGTALAGIADLDSDGRDELAVGVPGAFGARRGALRVLRGDWLAGNGGAQSLWEIGGAADGDAFGTSVAAVPDLSGDGLEELLVAAPRPLSLAGSGRAQLLSGADGASLFEVPALGPEEVIGASLGAVDLATDGAVELLVASPLDGAEERGVTRVFSFAPLYVAADRHRISLDQGGTMQMTIRAGVPFAGQLYVVLGTTTGTFPGLPSPVGTLPINWDAYSVYSLSNPADLVSFNGFLDANGEAASQVIIPQTVQPGLAKFQLHYACFTVDLGAPGFPTTSVSNAVPLSFDLDACVAIDPADDCNGNGVLDLCDITDGTSLDCDGNGVPDECQLLEPGADLDLDGVLDVCRQIVYVDADAVGSGTGTSWSDAYTDLRFALANSPPLAELWVAEGVYKPWPNIENDGASFDVLDGLAMFGGFDGTETSREQRDWLANPVILSGDLAGDDLEPGGSTVENSWNILATAETVGPTTRIEGFHVESGNADELPGCDEFAVFFSSCRGGGFYCLGSPTVRDCVFRKNFGGHHGGGVFAFGSPTFIDCAFEGNGALRGGGIYADVGAAPLFVNCVIRDNEALEGGGGFALGQSTQGPRFVNCLVTSNLAQFDGGGMFLDGVGIEMWHTTLAYNNAVGLGGGIQGVNLARAEVANSILYFNTAASGTLQEQQIAVAEPLVNSTVVQGGAAGLIGAGNAMVDPQFVDAAGPDLQLGTADDDFRLLVTSQAVDAANGLLIPLDLTDLDGDGNVSEPLPFDLDGNPRASDVPSSANTGVPDPNGLVPDPGPYERP